jgi:hypothetical protein
MAKVTFIGGALNGQIIEVQRLEERYRTVLPPLEWRQMFHAWDDLPANRESPVDQYEEYILVERFPAEWCYVESSLYELSIAEGISPFPPE